MESDELPRYRIAFSTWELDGKLPAGDPRWHKFNGSFENYEATIPAIAYMIDAGRPFTTCHRSAWRETGNYECGQHIGVDFDGTPIDAVLADPFVQQYAALVYRTPSDSPEDPRSRALFLLDQPIMQAANYVKAATALIWMFGGIADRKCKDAARFFYGSMASMPLRLDHVLPLATVRELIAMHDRVQPVQHRRPSTFTPTSIDGQEAATMLNRLAPSRADDYETWVTVGMALSTLGPEGLSLWDQWSSRSPKHVPGECARKWKSFDGEGVTMRTVALWANQDTPR